MSLLPPSCAVPSLGAQRVPGAAVLTGEGLAGGTACGFHVPARPPPRPQGQGSHRGARVCPQTPAGDTCAV